MLGLRSILVPVGCGWRVKVKSQGGARGQQEWKQQSLGDLGLDVGHLSGFQVTRWDQQSRICRESCLLSPGKERQGFQRCPKHGWFPSTQEESLAEVLKNLQNLRGKSRLQREWEAPVACRITSLQGVGTQQNTAQASLVSGTED